MDMSHGSGTDGSGTVPWDDDGSEPTSPQVQGYLIGAELGRGASGCVWRARPTGGGPEVAVKVLPWSDQAEREIGVLRGVRHQHVIGLRDAVVQPDGQHVALVLDLVDGGSLGELVNARGHLSAGEVVTVIAPLAGALADLHRQGIEHGDLAPGNVLFDRTGRPLLADLGTVRITGEPRAEAFGTPGFVDPVVLAGGLATPSSDVYGLGALAWFALTGAAPPAPLLRSPLHDEVRCLPPGLVVAVEAALNPDQAARPHAVDLAAQVFAAAPAEPVWLAGGTPTDGALTHRIRALAAADATDGGRGRVRRRRRRRRRALAATVVLGVLAVVGITSAVMAPRMVRTHRPVGQQPASDGLDRAAAPVTAATALSTPATAPPVVATSTDRARSTSARSGVVPGSKPAPKLSQARAGDLVRRLSRARALAFATADPVRISEVAVAGSPAAVTDRAAISTLTDRGLVYRDLHLEPVSVQLVAATAETATVDVVTDVSAYEVVDRTGTVLGTVPASPGTRSRLALVLTSAGWRVSDVTTT